MILYLVVNVKAQDVITLKNGEEIEASVQKIDDVNVEYKKWGYESPIYTIKKSEIFRITYQNGTKDVFYEVSESVENEVEQSNSAMLNVVYQPIAPPNIDMVFVNGGTFTMGCTSEQGKRCKSDEHPAHRVTLSSFYIGRYEVTQEQWVTVIGYNPSKFIDYGRPVEQVSWDDIVGTSGAYMEIKGIKYYENGFIYKLNQLTDKKYRLPTEAEWEYAARGGGRQEYRYSGGENVDRDNMFKTRPIGGKWANELGIYDMSGNVWEWGSDWYGSYSDKAATNPTGAAFGYSRVIRGGSFNEGANSLRVSNRNKMPSDFSYITIGFRLACSAE